LDQLIEAFYCLAPIESDVNYLKESRRWIFVIRRHIREVVDAWISNHVYYFAKNPVLEQRIMGFIDLMGDIQPGIVDETIQLLKNETEKWTSSHNLYLSIPYYFRQKSEKLVRSKKSQDDSDSEEKGKESTEIFKWTAKEIAKQLTLLEHGLMRMINCDEFLETRWRKPNKNELAPNICTMVEWFNNMTQWVETEIVIVTNMNKRVQKLTHFIQIAEYALKFKNYNLVKEICSALVASTVDSQRLKETWLKVKSSDMKKFDSLKNITDMTLNFSTYRQLIKENTRPIVPYLGVTFTDINAFEEVLRTKENGYYNIKKLRKVSERIKDFREQISGKFNFSENFDFIEWFAKERIIIEDQKERFDYSYKCEASKRQSTSFKREVLNLPNTSGEEKSQH